MKKRDSSTRKQERDRWSFPTRESVQPTPPNRVNGAYVSFDTTQEVAAALRALRATGLFGKDCATIAEELLRRALLDPTVQPHWRKIP